MHGRLQIDVTLIFSLSHDSPIFSEAARPSSSTTTDVSVPEDAETSETAKDRSTRPAASPGEHESETRSTRSESSKTSNNASPATGPQATSSTANLVGKINNLVTTDLGNIVDARSSFLYLLIFIPLQISLCIVFLYNILGWAAFVGVAIMVVSIPLQTVIARFIKKLQEKQMKNRDQRTRLMSELLANIRR